MYAEMQTQNEECIVRYYYNYSNISLLKAHKKGKNLRVTCTQKIRLGFAIKSAIKKKQ